MNLLRAQLASIIKGVRIENARDSVTNGINFACEVIAEKAALLLPESERETFLLACDLENPYVHGYRKQGKWVSDYGCFRGEKNETG